MPLVLTITSIEGRGADRQVRTLAQSSLSIGRAPGNDWVLADPAQHLSRTHCTISYDAGRYVLTDLSSNGMLINGAREPTARNSRTVLTDGDTIRLGGYLLEVAEADGAVGGSSASPFGATSFALTPADPFERDALGGDHALDVDPLDAPFGHAAALGFQHPQPQLPTPALRTEDPFDIAANERHRPGSLDDDDLFGAKAPDEFKGPAQRQNFDVRSDAFSAPRVVTPLDDIDFDALIGDVPLAPGAPPPAPSMPTPQPPAVAGPSPRPIEQAAFAPTPSPVSVPVPAPAIARSVPPPAAAPPVAAASGPPAAALIAAFLEGAGVPQFDLSAQEPEAAMRAIGALFRGFVEGTREALMSRAEIKQGLRVEQTMLRARDNNALKFSVSPIEALAALLQPDRPGYKPPLAAVEEAFKDIRSHEMAVMAGMQSALIALLGRFDPAVLEARLQRGMLDSILPGARKARFWEQFCTTYKEIAREAEDDFQSAFGRTFAKAYDAQVGKL